MEEQSNVTDQMSYDLAAETRIAELESTLSGLKATELRLNEDLERYSKLFDEAPVGYHELDSHGHIVRVNRTELEMLGYGVEEMRGQDIGKYFKSGNPNASDRLGASSGASHSLEVAARRKDGSLIPVQIDTRVMLDRNGEPNGYLVTVQDIRERNRIEGTLRQLAKELSKSNLELSDENWRRNQVEAELRSSIDQQRQLAEDHALIARVGRIVGSSHKINDVYEDLCKLAKEMVPHDNLCIVSVDRQHEAHHRLHVSGTDAWEHDAEEPMPLSGTLIKESIEKRGALVAQASRAGDVSSKYPGLAEEIESGFCSFLAVPLISNDTAIGAVQFQSKEPTIYTRRHKILAESFAAQIAGAIANSRLNDERSRLQYQLIHSQKMESIGTLASGVAHDFNNLLSAIVSYTELALRGSSRVTQSVGYLEEALKAATRASNLTRQLLVFSSRQIVETRIVCINDLVFDMEKMLRRLISENIELVILASDDLGMMRIDPNQMEQVLVNLTLNARDAMPNGGKLVIETANTTVGDEYARIHGVAAGEYVVLAISDTGTGMSDEVKARIFEPFFTTKEMGKGTGLGLSTSYGIVEHNGGNIQVESQLGKGSTFKIHIPRVDADVSPPGQLHEAPCLPTGDETVLVVEDEPAVRKVASLILRDRGYNVLEAENGMDALRVMQEGGEDDIDIVLTDVVMPLLGGKALAEKVANINPDIKILYASGYVDDLDLHQNVADAAVDFLRKPFTPADLLYKVRTVLDSR